MICPSNITAIRSDSDRISSSSTLTSRIALPCVAQADDLLVNEFDRADIHAARGLADQQQIGVALDLARQNDFLLVAATKILGGQARIGRAHVEPLHLGCGFALDRRVVHQHAALVRRIMVIAEERCFPTR